VSAERGASTNGATKWYGNLALKTFALMLACIFWFMVSGPRRERVSERAFAVPLSLAGVPRELVITTPVPDDVNVRLRGRVSDLRALSSQNLEVTVDMSWVQAGEAEITLRAQAINVPADVEVVSIDPSRMRFRVEPLRQRAVVIRPFLVGQPSPKHVVGDATVEPDRALVSGPASKILALSEVATERIIMTGRTETFVQNVAVVSDVPQVRVIAPLVTRVTVPVLAEVGPDAPVESPDVDEPQLQKRDRRKKP
jgi:YbbR domain-containing protein